MVLFCACWMMKKAQFFCQMGWSRFKLSPTACSMSSNDHCTLKPNLKCCLYFFYSISGVGSGCAAATAMQSVLRTMAQVLSEQLLNYAKAYIHIIVLWKYQLEHTSEQMDSMQICIVISATAASLICIKKTCRLDGRCSARVKRMWFSAIAKSSDVTHYIIFIHSRQLWFMREEVPKALTSSCCTSTK